MKVLFITAYPPTPHNIGVPSAHPFYLAKDSPSYIKKIDLIYFEGYEQKEILYEDEMKKVFGKIIKLKRTFVHAAFLKALDTLKIKHSHQGSTYRCLPSKNIIKYIKHNNYDLIWFYPCTLFPWYSNLNPYKIVLTGPDCSLLHYELIEQVYGNNPNAKKLLKEHVQIKRFHQLKRESIQREEFWSNSNALIHTVGLDDKNRYDKLGANGHTFFNPHPLYYFKEIKNPLDKHLGKLSILISGVNHSIYIGDLLDRIIHIIIKNLHNLKDIYKFHFLGNGFNENISTLKKNGFEVTSANWVDSYENEIAMHHIQLFPIMLGTGTKGKVLSALASGLLCIGTKYAFENIDIDPKNYILFTKEEEIIFALNNIYANKSHYAIIADEASKQVQINHSPKKTSELFWNHIIKYFNL